ncbi:MAG: aspartate/tyrosine/aromatic aminotransferase [Burkholderiaceae bacterium]|nr:aspartate/tyrosine/aromatic aminotransferase [Burkholderiaceae bacterium]
MSHSMFAAVPMAPRDPILGQTEVFNNDQRPEKINLGVGVYYDESGRIPLLAVVRKAEAQIMESAGPRGYLPIEGMAAYNAAVQQLLFGPDSPLLAQGRVATFECLGGTGALRVGAEFLRRTRPGARAWISDPSWENHRALFEAAGFEVGAYPYYDAATHGVRFDDLRSFLSGLPAGDVVVLHACCHNPTGVDLDAEQWAEIVRLCGERDLIAFLDMAYQGFGSGIDEDAEALRAFAGSGQVFLVASSFSKSFSLYGERVGALSVVASERDEAARVTSQIKRVIRANYSNPPTHGANIVARVLSTPDLRQLWEDELRGMRERIQSMRTGLVERLKSLGARRDFEFVEAQRGMFSYSGLSAAEVDRLREEFAIYAISTGRICVAALNLRNIDRVAEAVTTIVNG